MVGKSLHQLILLAKRHTVSWVDVLNSTICRGEDDWLGGQIVHGQDMGKIQVLF